MQEELNNNKIVTIKNGKAPNLKLFQSLYKRIYEILKQNYLAEFYAKVAQIPTKIYQKNTCCVGLRFNSVGEDIVD